MQNEQPIIVGIGASAGGLKALEEFFTHMPPDSGLAFILIQHLSPDYKSMMAELLSKYTEMHVHQAEQGMAVLPNNVYLIPPKVSLTIENHTLHLLTRETKPHMPHLPIDIFFHSLAQNSGHKAIAIVLSGTGSDGTLGLRSVKEAGGMTMAQDPLSAKFDGMPNSAIHTELVDIVLPPEKMPDHLLKYVQHPFLSKEDADTVDSRDEETIRSILSIIKQGSGVDFFQYKINTVARRIERRMSILQLENLKEYYEYLLQNKDEVEILHNELLIGVTRFFRDPASFELLNKVVVPRLFERLDNEPVRVWVAGCASGEEVYSIALLLLRYKESQGLTREIKIFASDVDRRGLEVASIGRYPETIVSDVPKEFLSEYFFRWDNDYAVTEKVRKMIVFARHNLLKDPPFNKVDLIVCRNLLIYFRQETQQQVLGNFAFSLRQDGFLFLGASESLGDQRELFHTLDSRWKIYQLKKGIPIHAYPVFSTPSIVRERRQRQSGIGAEPDNLYLEDIREKLTKELIPPTLIIDEDLNLLHTYNDVSAFLKIPVGMVSLSLTRMMPNAIALLIRNAIRRTEESNSPVYFTGLNTTGDDEENFSFRLERHNLFANSQSVYSLTFLRNKDSAHFRDMGFQNLSPEMMSSSYQEELERELRITKENLQSTVEELETSNEELQATNEELMSSNEELQSTNEELQSVNEELFTVNSEHQLKIEELIQLNHDMENYIQSTQIGVLFLDASLNIRKFTPSVQRYFPIMDQDAGRPLAHFASSLEYLELEADLRRVLHELRPMERYVVMKDGRTYQLRILPYLLDRGLVDGLILTFIDISQRVNLEKELQSVNERYQMILNTSRIAPWDWMDTDSEAMWWSPELCQLADTPDSRPDRTMREFLELFPDEEERQRVQKHLRELGPGSTSCEMQTVLRDRSGRDIPCRLLVLLHKEGATRRILGSLSPLENPTGLC